METWWISYINLIFSSIFFKLTHTCMSGVIHSSCFGILYSGLPSLKLISSICINNVHDCVVTRSYHSNIVTIFGVYGTTVLHVADFLKTFTKWIPISEVQQKACLYTLHIQQLKIWNTSLREIIQSNPMARLYCKN